jgi:uncharacterized Ntn-hydrolase superfamily protein
MLSLFVPPAAGRADTAAVPALSSLRPVHTYSIVARDPATGQLGVAVQSHWFAVGELVPWARAGVGAVATQSFVDVRYGVRGLELMAEGMSAEAALAHLLKADPHPEVRQVAMIDAAGGISQHTGRQCIAYAGQLRGDNFAVQANLMVAQGVPAAMAAAYRRSSGALAERMLAALEAAQGLGGDLRGKQAAAILVVRGKPGDRPWEDRLVDLHVEDHPAPLQELRRLLRLHKAYHHMNLGDHALESNNIEAALAQYGRAEALAPDKPEMKFWHAVSLVNAGRVNDSLPLFGAIFTQDGRWRELVPRLIKSGLLRADRSSVARIYATGEGEQTQ